MTDYNTAMERILACVVDVVAKSPAAPVDQVFVGKVMSRYGPMYALKFVEYAELIAYSLIVPVHFPGQVCRRIGCTFMSSTGRQAIASAPEQQISRVSSLQESSETLLIVLAFLASFNPASDHNPRHLTKPSDMFLTTLPTHHMRFDCAKIFPLLMILPLQRAALILASPHVLHLTTLEPRPNARPEAPKLVLLDLNRPRYSTVPLSPFQLNLRSGIARKRCRTSNTRHLEIPLSPELTCQLTLQLHQILMPTFVCR